MHMNMYESVECYILYLFEMSERQRYDSCYILKLFDVNWPRKNDHSHSLFKFNLVALFIHKADGDFHLLLLRY